MRSTAKCVWAGLILLGCGGSALCGEQPWRKDSAKWTAQDVQRILFASPWAQATNANFPAAERDVSAQTGPLPGAHEAGLAGARGAQDDHWDGGVGRMERGGPPSLPVMVRWESALPVREALKMEKQSNGGKTPYAEGEIASHYIISVSGLAPGGRFKEAGKLETKSESDSAGESGRELQDPEPMLEGLMANTRLSLRGRAPIQPSNARINAETGELYLFFPRTAAIDLRDKDVTFTTRFGSLMIEKRFVLKDMTRQGKLEL